MEAVPNWLVVTAEAAGMTSFTDEFDRAGKEWKPLGSSTPLIGKLIGRFTPDGNIGVV